MKAARLGQLTVGSATWYAVWEALAAAHNGDRVAPAANGETWQYMGTIVRGGTAKHEFRHRCYGGRRVYWAHETSFVPAEYSYVEASR